jgi:Sulfatase
METPALRQAATRSRKRELALRSPTAGRSRRAGNRPAVAAYRGLTPTALSGEPGSAAGTGFAVSADSAARSLQTQQAMRKQIAIGLSFANLCYLRVWSELLSYTPRQTYEMRLPPGPHDYLAAMLNVALWGTAGGLLAARLQTAAPATRRAARCVFLLALLIPLNALRAVLAGSLPIGQQYLKGGLYAALGPTALAAAAATAAGAALFLLLRHSEPATKLASAALLVFAPCVPLTLLQAGWKACHYDPAPFQNRPPAARVQTTPPPRRLVWVIFDEWDQRVSFEDRPADLALPEIDRFRGESFAAQNAYPPADNTLESMPSLITGRVVERAEPRGPAQLQLTFRGSPAAAGWSQVPNVFDAARDLGLDTALVGVYHPYCRVLARSLTSCWWSDIPRPINSNGGTLGEAMRGQTRSLFETWRLSMLGQSLSARRKGREFPKTLERAAAAAADPAYGLVLLHLLTPHFPHAYDRKSKTFTLANAPLRGYYDSLALTDRALGRLRRAMQTAGVWETTTVLLSSDHAMKHAALLDGKAGARVPFLLKFAGETAAYAYTPELRTVLTRDLLLEILRGHVANSREAAQWLDRRRQPAAWPSD